MEEHAPGGQSPGLLQSLRNLAATLVALLHTRLELLATELDEERLRIAQIIFWALMGLLFLTLGVLMLTVFVLIVFWDTHRVAVAAVLAAGYLAIGIVTVLVARNKARVRSRLFSESLGQLARDRERLSS